MIARPTPPPAGAGANGSLAASLALGAAEAGEHLRIAIEDANPACRLVITRPGSMRNLPDDLLFEGIGEATEPASLAGFSLRLVRGLARIAGGDLIASPTTVALVLPCA